ncbi:hypothetical protein Poli38472_010113 [Pythium oligandrum]|uniref:Uncharacterized protein n=1 Tax=Pythium oligandrum TaxID=41045 RepID=A0A8K1C8C6_PYTOL|nr:hypothetical protein Poli38472_010113 [Pythium oligandrum]|eukprot:TMW58554.1 hypothetical protein Poli38472_010113 [Pythium oligandrum]
MLMQYAAKRGWWSFVVLTSRQGRRWSRLHASDHVLVDLGNSDNEELTQCQQFIRQFPVKFDADVMYAAAERGIMAEVVWLHRHTDYEAKEAIEKAAIASNIDVLVCLLDHEDTARNRFDPSDREQCVVWLRQNESSIRATCWFDPNEYTIHCVLAGVGRLPPMESHSRMYPIMDWAAKQGNLALLKRLDGDPSGKDMCTAAAMVHAAENGDLAVMQLLSEHRSESLDSPIDPLSAAARQGHLAMMDWVHLRYAIPSHMLHRPFADALSGGHFGSLRWFVSHFNDNLRELDSCRTYAMHGNNPEIVRYVCEELGYELSFADMEFVVWRGGFDVAQWMVRYHQN